MKKKSKKKPAKRKPARRAPAKSRAQPIGERLISELMTMLPLTIGKEQTLADAHQLMRENNIRHLPVLDGGAVFGIVSQRDLLLIETLRDVDPNEVTVEEATSRDAYMVRYDATLGAVAAVMADRKLGAALVVDDDQKIIGVFTTTDALRAIAG